MKKLFSAVLALVLACSLLTGCTVETQEEYGSYEEFLQAMEEDFNLGRWPEGFAELYQPGADPGGDAVHLGGQLPGRKTSPWPDGLCSIPPGLGRGISLRRG